MTKAPAVLASQSCFYRGAHAFFRGLLTPAAGSVAGSSFLIWWPATGRVMIAGTDRRWAWLFLLDRRGAGWMRLLCKTVF